MNTEQLFINAYELCNDDSIADLFRSINKNKIICFDNKECNCYYFDPSINYYRVITLNELSQIICNEIKKYISNDKTFDNIKITDYDREIKSKIEKIKILSKSIGQHQKQLTIVKNFCNKVYDDKINMFMDQRRDIIAFKNGIVSLRDGKFNKSTDQDLISIYLNYDYNEQYDKKEYEKLYNVLKQIFNNDEEQLKGELAYRGYSITGETCNQIFMCYTGYTASNGKSFIRKLNHYAFDVYSEELPSKIFDEGFSKAHKYLIDLKNKRMAWIEEFSKNKKDDSLIKSLVDDGQFKTEVMYGTNTTIPILFKIANYANNDFYVNPNDKGIIRRAYQTNLNNIFCKGEEEYKHMKNKYPNNKNIYIANLEYEQMIKNDSVKLAYFHMLLPYAILYYKNNKQINLHSSVKKNILNNVEDNDIYQNFINECLEYVEGEYINKDELLDTYRIFSHRLETQWQTLLQNLQARHIKYNCDKKKDKVRGCIENYKFKNNTIDESPLDNGIINIDNNHNIDLIKENEELKDNYKQLLKEYNILMLEKKDIENKYNQLLDQHLNKNDIIDNVYVKLQNEILQVKNMFDLKTNEQELRINKKDNIICNLEKKLKKLKKKFKKITNIKEEIKEDYINPLDNGINTKTIRYSNIIKLYNDEDEEISIIEDCKKISDEFKKIQIDSSDKFIPLYIPDIEVEPKKIKKNKTKTKKIYPGFENCELEDFLDVPFE